MQEEQWLVPVLSGRTALVIGGSSGTGRGTAWAVAARGGDVVVTSRSADRLHAAVSEVLDGLVPLDGARQLGQVTAVSCDLADETSVRAAVAAPDRLDHLVLTAKPGRGATGRSFFDAAFWGSQVAVAAAGERLPSDGSVLLASGGLAARPTAGQWSVTCAFAAVEALARAMAVELAPRRVNCVRLGLFDTATWDHLPVEERVRALRERSAQLPAGRPGTEDDFGDFAVGLLTAEYLTGQVIALDGGQALIGG
jgi:NAD(P)-dependent dehydrogenase (short-subunit alcohol dehydrogenase family)